MTSSIPIDLKVQGIHFSKQLAPIYMSAQISVDRASEPEVQSKISRSRLKCYQSRLALWWRCTGMEWCLLCLQTSTQVSSAALEEGIKTCTYTNGATEAESKVKLLFRTLMCFLMRSTLFFFPLRLFTDAFFSITSKCIMSIRWFLKLYIFCPLILFLEKQYVT